MHIWASLHNYAYKEAVFAAERLFAETKSDESLYLLASCLYRMGRPKQAIRLLTTHGCTSSKVRFLLARCYFDCNMLNEAEDAIIGNRRPLKCITEIIPDFGDQACYALSLLGDVYKLQQNFADAVTCYKACLKLNPIMWTPYESLCCLGDFVEPDNIFKLNQSIGLITPTFTIVGQAVGPVKSPVNVNVKAERDRLGSRENVNPNSPTNDAISGAPDADTEKLTANSTQIVKSTYISQCVTTSQDYNVTQPHLSDDPMNNFTPAGYSLHAITPSAPLVNQEKVQPKCPSAGDSFPTTGGNTSKPSFGALSMIPQSPMFACVPVSENISFFCILHCIYLYFLIIL